jgi:hypothetical protein
MKTRRKYVQIRKISTARSPRFGPQQPLLFRQIFTLDDASSDRQGVYTKTGAFVIAFYLSNPTAKVGLKRSSGALHKRRSEGSRIGRTTSKVPGAGSQDRGPAFVYS